MKPQSIISRVDDVKPNTFSDETKLSWLNTAEGYVAVQIHKVDFTPHESISDVDLLVTAPYSVLYEYYLKAMIDYENKDFESYSTNTVLYNAAFSDYSKYYIRTTTPTTAPLQIKNYW
jgi:hypothetical protein